MGYSLRAAMLVALATWCGVCSAIECGCSVVVEYYNTTLDHYFLAILPKEIAAIDEGKAGPGWSRTGETFRSEDYSLYTYGSRVYRFYGSVAPGPNSHFFTMNGAEGQELVHLDRTTPEGVRKWHFERFDFVAGPIGREGCQYPHLYTVPVFRLYNNGAARGIDVNHRYTKSSAVVDEMLAKGWIFEGAAFCVIR